MNSPIAKILSFLLIVATCSGAAFLAPGSRSSRTSAAVSKTQVKFGFLKDLGLEKPDWLPDFGGEKEEKKPEPVATDGEATGEEGEAEGETPPSE